MNRNLRTDSIILKSRRLGELHKGVTILTKSHGIIDAIAYGAGKGKSKLSGMVDPFSLLHMYLYYNPVNNNYKVSDIEQRRIFPGIRSELTKFYIASFWSELILKTYSGGGESELIYPLFAESLTELNAAGKEKQTLILIQFIWRYLGISGFRPDIENCGRCDSMFSVLESAWFDERDNQIICNKCKPDIKMLKIPFGGLKYLRHTVKLDLNKSMKIGLDSISAETLKRILLVIIQGIVEYPLNTLKNGLI